MLFIFAFFLLTYIDFAFFFQKEDKKNFSFFLPNSELSNLIYHKEKLKISFETAEESIHFILYYILEMMGQKDSSFFSFNSGIKMNQIWVHDGFAHLIFEDSPYLKIKGKQKIQSIDLMIRSLALSFFLNIPELNKIAFYSKNQIIELLRPGEIQKKQYLKEDFNKNLLLNALKKIIF